MDLRIGNDFDVVWSIYRDGEPFDLSEVSLTLYLKNIYGKKSITDFTVEDNKVKWTFFGKDQKQTGKYTLILVGNEDEEGMFTTDAEDFVRLVSRSSQVDNEPSENADIQIEVVEISSNIRYGEVDTELDTESTNAIANKAVAERFEQQQEEIQQLKENELQIVTIAPLSDAKAIKEAFEKYNLASKVGQAFSCMIKEEASEKGCRPATLIVEHFEEGYKLNFISFGATSDVIYENSGDEGEMLFPSQQWVWSPNCKLVDGVCLSFIIDGSGYVIPLGKGKLYNDTHILNGTSLERMRYRAGGGEGSCRPFYNFDKAALLEAMKARKILLLPINDLYQGFIPVAYSWDSTTSVEEIGERVYLHFIYEDKRYKVTIPTGNISLNWMVNVSPLYDDTEIKAKIDSMMNILGNIDRAIPTAYSELKAHRDNGLLKEGSLYRITDYVTTTSQTDTKSAGHAFDVVVLALTNNTLAERAWACLHEGDTYFASSDLESWQIWYSLDNDAERFAWADAENGKGVIYRMIDERNNVCPYDFKNILFEHPIDTATYPLLYYTFSKIDENVIDNSMNDGCYGNTIGFHILSGKKNLNANVFINTSTTDCYRNSLGINSRNNHFGDGCYYNELGLAAEKNLFGDGCYSNVAGNSFKNNTFGANCHSNTFGTRCYNNVLWEKCYYNTFGTNCFENTLGMQSYHNVFSNDCYKNTLGSDCTYNTFGVHCPSNTLGDSCMNNRFGSNCGYMTMSRNCVGNIFESGCKNNRLGLDCRYNYFGAECNEITFGSSKTDISDGYSHNIFDAGVNRLYLKCSESYDYSKYVRRYHITSDVYNTTIDVVRNLNKQIQVSKNSKKEVVQFCLADMVDALSQITIKVEE